MKRICHVCKIVTMHRESDRAFLKNIPDDFPLDLEPYKEIGKRCSIDSDEIIKRLKKMLDEGVIRRIAAVLYHRNVSYTHNAMVVWRVEKEDIEKTGNIMASFPEVSHCYERDTGGYWGYNIYTMIHGKSREDCLSIVRRISDTTGKRDFKIFFSKREFKKTSIKVINE
ncbi:MAG: hypothetical protein N3D15_07985 [Syntrophorhabdaceae bacterium]|nr:hypothetical protein [Syntrophorhabdaceae bacterium]